LLEWDWDVNGDLDPRAVAAGGKQRVAWRCLLNSEHVWETRIADRTYRPSFCPCHMGNRVHPSEAVEAQFRRVQGHRELPALAAALQREFGIPAPATVTA
jgi:hypothetical protein